MPRRLIRGSSWARSDREIRARLSQESVVLFSNCRSGFVLVSSSSSSSKTKADIEDEDWFYLTRLAGRGNIPPG